MELRYFFPKAVRKLFNRCAIQNSNIDKTAKYDVGSLIVNSSMGRYSYIGEHTSLIYTDIGSFSSISNYCMIGGGQHPVEWVSTSPVFNNTRSILRVNFSQNKYTPFQKTFIGNDVWIGANCMIRGGVHIADGAVIGMGSVVTRDVGPYEIWAGNPARFIKKRFGESEIRQLLQLKWWQMDDGQLRQIADSFNDIHRFLEILKESSNENRSSLSGMFFSG